MDEVVASDGQRVAVARRHPDREVGIGGLDARGDGVRTSVDAVEAERRPVVDEARRAADARDEGELVVRRVGRIGHFGQCALHGVEDGVVAAARAPAYLLVALEIRRSGIIGCHRGLLQ